MQNSFLNAVFFHQYRTPNYAVFLTMQDSSINAEFFPQCRIVDNFIVLKLLYSFQYYIFDKCAFIAMVIVTIAIVLQLSHQNFTFKIDVAVMQHGCQTRVKCAFSLKCAFVRIQQ
jgi:hypothetical protein